MTNLLSSPEGLRLVLSAWVLIAWIAIWGMHRRNYKATVQDRHPPYEFEHYGAAVIWPFVLLSVALGGALFTVCYPPARLAEWLSRHVAAQAERERDRLQAEEREREP